VTIRRKPRRHLTRQLSLPVLWAAVIWVTVISAGATTPASAAERAARQGELAMVLLRSQLGLEPREDSLPGPVALAISQSPLLLSAKDEVLALRRQQEEDRQEEAPPQEQPEPVDTEIKEEAVEPAQPLLLMDNGVPARTLVPTSAEGYVAWRQVLIDNRSDKPLEAGDLEGGFDAGLSAQDGPKVLIVHTHGSEAYTMPPGQEYIPSSECRTTDRQYNVVRVGRELADTLEERGIEVVQDTGLHDYPQYSGAYDRSLESVEDYLERWPTISIVIDVHRDAVTDAGGEMYKVVSPVAGVNAAQMSFVAGSDGGGLEHPKWLENLKLAAAVQQRLTERYPTLMRPITLRNSRYNQHVTTGSLLVEMGAAGNSLDEALLSARLLGAALAEVLLEQETAG